MTDAVFRDYQSSGNAKDFHLLASDRVGVVAVGKRLFGSEHRTAPRLDHVGLDQERTGWNKGENSLSRDNVSSLRLSWITQLTTPPKGIVLSTLTAPLVAEHVSTPHGPMNLLFVLGADDTIFALNVDTGKVIWQKTFANPATPMWAATWPCSNTVNDTPVIDEPRQIIFLITSDGKLRALNLSDGTDRMKPAGMVEPFARAWSLNLIDNVVYTTSGRGCGQLPASPGVKPSVAPGSVSAMEVGRFYWIRRKMCQQRPTRGPASKRSTWTTWQPVTPCW